MRKYIYHYYARTMFNKRRYHGIASFDHKIVNMDDYNLLKMSIIKKFCSDDIIIESLSFLGIEEDETDITIKFTEQEVLFLKGLVINPLCNAFSSRPDKEDSYTKELRSSVWEKIKKYNKRK